MDFDQKEKQDEPLLCLIGFIRSCGAIDPMVVQMQAQKYGLDLRNLETNPLFNFWTYYTFDYLIPDATYGEAILFDHLKKSEDVFDFLNMERIL